MSKNDISQQGALWGGRFRNEPSEELKTISKSTYFDFRLAYYDLLGSKAHAKALEKAGYLTTKEETKLQDSLDLMIELSKNSKLHPKECDEDLHGALERILIEDVGEELGGKLRAGRSRNDQIATSMRQYLKDQKVDIVFKVLELVSALVNKASDALSTSDGESIIMIGRTHLQAAQPVLLSHHLLAHCWPLIRDVKRLSAWYEIANLSPYGSGALAGQSLGLDQKLVAKSLGFQDVEPNSIDAVSSRDIVYEFAFIMSSIAINLSRLSEEIILFSTKEFGYFELADEYSTGSSIMPQKKNPDIAELTRGKSGRIIGDFMGLLTTCKGLPLAYNRDLQEDKEPVFDIIDQLQMILPAFTGMIETIKFNQKAIGANVIRGFSLATDVAEWLVKQGVPFKQAHERAGQAVSFCEAKADTLDREFDLYDLDDKDFELILKVSNIKDLRKILNVQGSVDSRDNYNGTAVKSVKAQLVNIIKVVNDLRK